jgi:transcriptional regulator GlxA family with amidase domain
MRNGFFQALADTCSALSIERIHRDCTSALNLEDLARETTLSRSAFAKRFKEAAEITPIDYLSKWRILMAGDFMKSSDMSLAQISECMG